MKDPNRLHLIKKSFDSLIKTTPPENIIVVDDWSQISDHIAYIKSLWIKVIEKPVNWWYAKAKNTLIKYFMDAWHDIWFLADDDNTYSEWWEKQYLEAIERTWRDHWNLRLSYLTLDKSNQPYWDKQEKNWYKYRQTPLCNWCFNSFSRRLIEKIGYMNELPNKLGHEHSFFTQRAIANWFAPHYIDVLDPKVNNLQILDENYVVSADDAYDIEKLMENWKCFTWDKNKYYGFHE